MLVRVVCAVMRVAMPVGFRGVVTMGVRVLVRVLMGVTVRVSVRVAMPVLVGVDVIVTMEVPMRLQGGAGSPRVTGWTRPARRHGETFWLSMRMTATAAPNPLSMFTTVTPDAQLVSMPSRAVKPDRAVP